MSESKLLLHCGAREISREELDAISAKTPPATRSWVPIAHSTVLDAVQKTMAEAGFVPKSVRIGVARSDHRLFATIDTSAGLNGGEVSLAVAVVNSTDKGLLMKLVAGARVFCCVRRVG